MKAIAVSDHDTMSGVSEAISEGKQLELQVIPAVEMTVIDTKRNRPVHVLCYLPETVEPLNRFLQPTLDNRRAQKLEMIQKIQKIYPLLELEHVFRYAKNSRSIYEAHIMQSLCDLGYTNTAIGVLMEELISKKGSCYVPGRYPAIHELMEVLEEVKAVVVVAHPEEFNSFELAQELAREGKIHGLEYDHPRNGKKGRKKIKEIAQEYHLILTGGSDFHGQYAKKTFPIGSFGCEEKVITQMEEIMSR